MATKSKENLFSQEELVTKQINDDLPPPGAARDNVLAQRKDALEEKVETSGFDRGKIPEKFLEEDREIQYAIHQDYMSIGVGHPYYITCWVNYVNVGGQMVWNKKSQGWRVATAVEFPEAEHLKREDNTIRVGDTLLMFMRIDEHAKMVKRQKQLLLQQQYGSESQIRELVEKYPGVFKDIHFEGDGTAAPELQQQIERRRNVQSTALRSIGNKMKTGLVPGIQLK